MLFRTRRVFAALCALLMIAGVTLPAAADTQSYINSSGNMIDDSTSPPMVDLFLLRPLGLVTFLVGTALFIVPALPLTVITRPTDIGAPFEALVLRPARYVWVDPLGSH